jgi:hypothetical protein
LFTLDARLLRVQIIGGDETGLLPIVIADHSAGTHAADDDNAALVAKFFEDFPRVLGMTSAQCHY